MPSLASLSSLPGECGNELNYYGGGFCLPHPQRVREITRAKHAAETVVKMKYLNFERIDHTGLFRNPPVITPGVAKQMVQQFRETHSPIAERAQQLLSDWDKSAMPARLCGEPPVSLEGGKDPAWSQVFYWHYARLGAQKYNWLHKTFQESIGRTSIPSDQYPIFLTILRKAS